MSVRPSTSPSGRLTGGADRPDHDCMGQNLSCGSGYLQTIGWGLSLVLNINMNINK
jgi:hypothetical protein